MKNEIKLKPDHVRLGKSCICDDYFLYIGIDGHSGFSVKIPKCEFLDHKNYIEKWHKDKIIDELAILEKEEKK